MVNGAPVLAEPRRQLRDICEALFIIGPDDIEQFLYILIAPLQEAVIGGGGERPFRAAAGKTGQQPCLLRFHAPLLY